MPSVKTRTRMTTSLSIMSTAALGASCVIFSSIEVQLRGKSGVERG